MYLQVIRINIIIIIIIIIINLNLKAYKINAGIFLIGSNVYLEFLTLSCLPIYPMPSLKVFYQNMDYSNELNIYQNVLNEFRPNFAETW